MTEKQLKHLEFVQNVITRMNSNSFQIKGWAITIVSALLALYASSSNVIYIFVGVAPTLLFWFLDVYYLKLERKYRGLYDDIANITVKQDKSKPVLFSMSVKDYDEKRDHKYSFCSVFWSKTIAWLYLVVILSLTVGGLIIFKFRVCLKISFTTILASC